ncbi:MAG: cobalamin-binding protein [Anaerolineales bacterium]|nr:MAG: cobalamin-binding protein [Anaerolineales bacterium]
MDETEASVQNALGEGLSPERILSEAMTAALARVGELFEAGEYFVPEMLISANAMQKGMAVLKPHLVEVGLEPAGKIVIGTVKGDLHDIGKNLVAMLLEGAGFEVVDLGTDIAPERFIEAIEREDADLLGLSALLTTTMENMRLTMQVIQSAGVRELVKVMIGGAPVTDAFAADIGADGYAPDASRAVALAKKLAG